MITVATGPSKNCSRNGRLFHTTIERTLQEWRIRRRPFGQKTLSCRGSFCWTLDTIYQGVTKGHSIVSNLTMKLTAWVAGFSLAGMVYAQLTAPSLVGAWEGESKCTDLKAAPGCHDEHVIYHFTTVKGKPMGLHVQADRLTDNKLVNMGDLDFTFDPKTSVLTNFYDNGRTKFRIDLTVKGNSMTGQMTLLPSKAVVRKIKISRRNP